MWVEDTDIGESWVECQIFKFKTACFGVFWGTKETAVDKQVETT